MPSISDLDAAGAAEALIVQLETRHVAAEVALLHGREQRAVAALAARLHAAVAVQPGAQPGHDHREQLPAAGAAVDDVLVVVVHVAARDQHEAVPGVAEATLQLAAHGRGDRVGGDRRVAVVRDARDHPGVALSDARELGEERAQRVGVLDRLARA